MGLGNKVYTATRVSAKFDMRQRAIDMRFKIYSDMGPGLFLKSAWTLIIVREGDMT